MSERGKKFYTTKHDELTVGSILEKVREASDPVDSAVAKMGFDQLYSLLDDRELQFVGRILAINPINHGVNTLHLGVIAPPSDLIPVRGQSYQIDIPGGQQETPIETQYLPERTYRIYLAMNEHLTGDLGRGLVVESGYRSPAFQVVTLLDYFQRFDFDLNRVFKLVAAVGHSEHGFPEMQAIDFAPKAGVSKGGVDERFALTQEYYWLLKHAPKYGFTLSYPECNPDGITFEPWHWSHRK